MTQCIERGICFREHVLLIWELGTVIGMGGDWEGSNKQKPVAPSTREQEDGGGKGAGEAAWLSPPSPSPRGFPGGCGRWLRWHPGIPRERPACCCGYGCHHCMVPLSPSGLVTAWLCSDKLNGAVSIEKRLGFGNGFCGGVVPTRTISLLHLAAFSGKCEASSLALKSPRDRSKWPHPRAGQLPALAANSTSVQ